MCMWACPRHHHVNMVRLYCPIAAANNLVSQLKSNILSSLSCSRLNDVTRRSFGIRYHDNSCRRAYHHKDSTSVRAVPRNYAQHSMTRIFHSAAVSSETIHSSKHSQSPLRTMSSVIQDLSSPEVTPKRTKSSCTDHVNGVDTELQRFDDLFCVLVEDLSNFGSKNSEIVDALDRFKQVNEYNVPHGKKNRGLTVMHSYRYLMSSKSTDEGEKLAMILGWCIEWLQAYFLVADDIMDGSVTRRGQPCWYKQSEVGLIAINDSFYLESAIYFLLKKYFRHLPYYADLVDLFHETTLQTVIGQNLDLITAPTDRVDFSLYSIERYNAIVKYKTAFYSFYLPVACAMYMAGINDAASHSNAQTILLKMGEYFQIQDDYLDCYGDPSITGKIGTDIEDNKCSWLIVQALSRANDEQRAVLLANYARHDPACVEQVKTVYNELGLPGVYTDYEDQSYSSLIGLIDTLSGRLPRDMFVAYADKIYKRKK